MYNNHIHVYITDIEYIDVSTEWGMYLFSDYLHVRNCLANGKGDAFVKIFWSVYAYAEMMHFNAWGICDRMEIINYLIMKDYQIFSRPIFRAPAPYCMGRCQYIVTGWDRNPLCLCVVARMMSDTSLGSRPRDSLVTDGDFKKPTKITKP